MTESEIDDYWLRIGYSENDEIINLSEIEKKTGEKKVLVDYPADRLGFILEHEFTDTKATNC